MILLDSCFCGLQIIAARPSHAAAARRQCRRPALLPLPVCMGWVHSIHRTKTIGRTRYCFHPSSVTCIAAQPLLHAASRLPIDHGHRGHHVLYEQLKVEETGNYGFAPGRLIPAVYSFYNRFEWFKLC